MITNQHKKDIQMRKTDTVLNAWIEQEFDETDKRNVVVSYMNEGHYGNEKILSDGRSLFIQGHLSKDVFMWAIELKPPLTKNERFIN